MFERVFAGRREDFTAYHREAGAFAYAKHVVTPKSDNHLHVSFMEIPPGRSAFPYHWHEGITEAYVILSGTGCVRVAACDIMVGPGHVIVFPPGPAGAHRMTNTSATEPLCYVDLDTVGYPDVVHHVDSGKVGISGGDDEKIFHQEDAAVDFYAGEIPSVN